MGVKSILHKRACACFISVLAVAQLFFFLHVQNCLLSHVFHQCFGNTHIHVCICCGNKTSVHCILRETEKERRHLRERQADSEQKAISTDRQTLYVAKTALYLQQEQNDKLCSSSAYAFVECLWGKVFWAK